MKKLIVLFAVVALSMTKKHRCNAPAVFDQIEKINEQSKSSNSKLSNNSNPELFEGDIVWTESLKDDVNNKEIGADQSMTFSDVINNRAWVGGVIPYAFEIRFNSKGHQVVKEAVAQFNKHTCLKWIPRTTESDYVIFFHGRGCSSVIGKDGGQQLISLGNPGCLHRGIAMHEMMHCAGFYHEQSRRDRDSYIKVHFGNVKSGLAYNFKMYRGGTATTLGAAYDKRSLMHYGNKAFSKNGRETITSLSNTKEKLGQMKQFSKIDIEQLNKYYNCKGKTKILEPKKCADKYDYCPSLQGYCHVTWVKENCIKTCTNCSGQKSGSKKPKGCVDTSTHCAAWKKKGYCKSKDIGYLRFMKAVCRKSCGFCR